MTMVSTSTDQPPQPEPQVIPETRYGRVDHGTLDEFERFAFRYVRVGEGVVKQPLILEWFQRKILADYFNGVPETLILLPKGNGKSTLLAALALYHLYKVVGADIKIVAASRPGAEQIFEFAHAMVEASPALKKIFKVTASVKEIKNRRGLGKLKALPAEVSSIDGKAPTLVLADELHHWTKPEVYAMLAGGLFKKGGRLFGISTAGADLSSFLGVMRSNALQSQNIVEKSDFYTYAITPDREFALHEWSLPKGWDHTDFAAVKECNPLAAISEETLRRKYNSPSTIPTLWCRLHCNQWVQDADALIDADEWDDLKRPGCLIDECAKKYIGADFGWRKDTTALVPVGVVSLSPLVLRVDARLKITPAPENGGSTSVETIKKQFREFHALWPDMVVVMDPNAGGHIIAQWLTDELGVEVIEQPQDPSPMAHAAGLTSELVRGGHLEHPDNAEFTRQVVNAPGETVSKAGDRMRFGKHSTVPNDGAIALCMPVRQAHVYEPEDEPVMPVFYT